MDIYMMIWLTELRLGTRKKVWLVMSSNDIQG